MMMQSFESNRAARPLLQKSTEIDPGFADAHAWLAMSHFSASTMWGETADAQLARTSAKRAVTLDPENAEAFMILGYVHMYDGHLSEAATEFATALRINPNLADAWALQSDLMVFEGRAADGINCVEHAFRLNPNPPRVYYWTLGFAAYAARRYGLAVETLLHEATYRTGSQRILAASLAQLGQLKQAESEAQQFLSANPDFKVRQWADAHPFRHAADRQHFIDGYVKAGLPS
jgi:tetratricopeptide (TPR) repeat protein